MIQSYFQIYFEIFTKAIGERLVYNNKNKNYS